jgi:hypothetical protein
MIMSIYMCMKRIIWNEGSTLENDLAANNQYIWIGCATILIWEEITLEDA